MCCQTAAVKRDQTRVCSPTGQMFPVETADRRCLTCLWTSCKRGNVSTCAVRPMWRAQNLHVQASLRFFISSLKWNYQLQKRNVPHCSWLSVLLRSVCWGHVRSLINVRLQHRFVSRRCLRVDFSSARHKFMSFFSECKTCETRRTSCVVVLGAFVCWRRRRRRHQRTQRWCREAGRGIVGLIYIFQGSDLHAALLPRPWRPCISELWCVTYNRKKDWLRGGGGALCFVSLQPLPVRGRSCLIVL